MCARKLYFYGDKHKTKRSHKGLVLAKSRTAEPMNALEERLKLITTFGDYLI